MRAMITNGGPHPADRWAEVTTDAILGLIQVADDSDTSEATMARQAKRDLRPVLFGIFNEHHYGVQQHERGTLAKESKSTLAKTLNVAQHMTITQEVDAALAATPFAAHFAKPEVATVVHNIIGQHTADVMHIERRWHADRLAEGI